MLCRQALAFLLWVAPLPEMDSEDLLERRLELALQEQAYLELESSQARAFIGAMEVQSIPLQWRWRFPAKRVGVSRVSRLIPSLPEKVVTVCADCDDSSAAASLEDRIGIEDMPTDFAVVLSDGSHWLVQSEKGWGPRSLWEETYWRWRVSLPYVRSLAKNGKAQLLVSRMPPRAARTLYWTLRPHMGVLRGSHF